MRLQLGRHAASLPLRPLGAPRLPAPDDAQLCRCSAASSSGRTLDDTHGDLIRRKGDEHEAAYLARLEADGRTIVRIPTYDDEGFDADEARRLTEEAIRAGEADVIYQPYLSDGDLARVRRLPRAAAATAPTRPSTRSSRARPSRRTCCSSASTPSSSGGSRGGCRSTSTSSSARGERETFRTAEYMAYYRRTRGAVPRTRSTTEPETYPWPCDHCGLCDFRNLCKQRSSRRRQPRPRRGPAAESGRDADRATGSRRSRRSATRSAAGLEVDGMRAGDARGAPPPGRAPAPLPRDGRAPRRPPARRGGARLPAPARARLRRRLARPRGPPVLRAGARARVPVRLVLPRRGRRRSRYEAAWARDRDGEREIFERFVDWVVERRRRYPGAARLPLRRLRAHRRCAASWASTARASRRSTTSCATRCSSTSTASSSRRCARRSRATRSRRSRRCTGSCARPRSTGGDESTVRFEKWLESGDDSLLRDDRGLQRGGLPLDRRAPRVAAARSGRRTSRGARRRTSAERAEEEDARDERAALRDALLARSAEEGDAALAPRAAPRLPPPRGEAAVVGVVPLPAARRGGADRGHGHDRRARARRRARASRQELASTRSRSPSRSTRSRATRSIRRRRRATRSRSTTSTALVTLRRGKTTAPTSRCRARSSPGQPIHDKEQREALSRLRARVPRRRRRPTGARRAVLERRCPRCALDLATRSRPRSTLERQLPLRAGPARARARRGRARRWRSR